MAVFKRLDYKKLEILNASIQESKNANGPVQLIPMPSALLSWLLLAQEIMPKASGDT